MERSGLIAAACVGRHDVGPSRPPRRGHVRQRLQPGSSRGIGGTQVCTCLPGESTVCCAPGTHWASRCQAHWVGRGPSAFAMVSSGALPGCACRLSRSRCSCERWAVDRIAGRAWRRRRQEIGRLRSAGCSAASRISPSLGSIELWRTTLSARFTRLHGQRFNVVSFHVVTAQMRRNSWGGAPVPEHLVDMSC